MSTTRHLALYITEELLGLTEEGEHVFGLVSETGASVFFDTLTEDGRQVTVVAAAAAEDTTTKYHVTAQVM